MPFTFTPTPPRQCQYEPSDISAPSGTQFNGFKAGIDLQQSSCAVCGETNKVLLDYCHIVPQDATARWKYLRKKGNIPPNVKSVWLEPRNGILLCKAHHHLFNSWHYYIRWIPEVKVFVVVNQSREPILEPYHGRIVQFSDQRLKPFPAAFMNHELISRGHFWYWFVDRKMVLDVSPPVGGDSEGSVNDQGAGARAVQFEDGQVGSGQVEPIDGANNLSKTLVSSPSAQLETQQHDVLSQPKPSKPRRQKKKQTKNVSTFSFTPRDPSKYPDELNAIMNSARQQPDWKEAVTEGETWVVPHTRTSQSTTA